MATNEAPTTRQLAETLIARHAPNGKIETVEDLLVAGAAAHRFTLKTAKAEGWADEVVAALVDELATVCADTIRPA